MKVPPERVVAYTAGLFDGEGTLSAQHSYAITIYNTHERALLWCQEQFGVGHVRLNTPGSERKKPLYRWTVTRQSDAIEFAQTILPYSIIRKGDLIAFVEVIKREIQLRDPDTSHQAAEG